MLTTLHSLTYAHARQQEFEREAAHERLLREARAALRACCSDEDDETCCPPGNCDEPARSAWFAPSCETA